VPIPRNHLQNNVILSAAKNLVRKRDPTEILRCAQDDRCPAIPQTVPIRQSLSIIPNLPPDFLPIPPRCCFGGSQRRRPLPLNGSSSCGQLPMRPIFGGTGSCYDTNLGSFRFWRAAASWQPPRDANSTQPATGTFFAANGHWNAATLPACRPSPATHSASVLAIAPHVLASKFEPSPSCCRGAPA
jgi:hypothetical protein